MYACLNQEDSMKGQLQSEPFANVPCLVNKNLQLKTESQSYFKQFDIFTWTRIIQTY